MLVEGTVTLKGGLIWGKRIFSGEGGEGRKGRGLVELRKFTYSFGGGSLAINGTKKSKTV